jgi:hypothetical protein
MIRAGDGRKRRAHTRLTATFAVVALAVVLSACSSQASPGPSTPSPTSSNRPSSTATLSIVEPTNGEVVHSSTVHVVISLKHATIVPATTTNIRPDQGHLHLYLDGQIVSMNYQVDATLPNVSPGQHLLRVEFVASDHAPFDPRVFTQLTFTVQP